MARRAGKRSNDKLGHGAGVILGARCVSALAGRVCGSALAPLLIKIISEALVGSNYCPRFLGRLAGYD